MIVSIHQPNYIPWIGTIDKIIKSDIFVFFDNIQYVKNSIVNRNKIKAPHGPIWLTVPVVIKGRHDQLIKETHISPHVPKWMDEHKKLIYIHYKNANAFHEFFPVLENILYSKKWEFLADFNIEIIKVICDFLQIKTQLIRASDLGVEGCKTELLVNICKKLGATHHLTGSTNKPYMQWELFEANGIDILHQNFQHPIYPQLHGDFISNLSCIDMLLNLGKKTRDYFQSKNGKNK